jgi:Ca2+-binding EF-hand superfamily protein
VASWQRDYNTKGLCHEKCTTLRYQRVVKMKQEALKEAARRNVEVEVVEEEMYQALRARSHRIDTNLRKCEFHAPTRAVPVNGGPPKIFDGSEKLEENFSFTDARDMFRGDAWEAMVEGLEETKEEFKPPPRGARTDGGVLGDNKRGSFSMGFTPVELAKAQQAQQISAARQRKEEAVREDLEKLKYLIARKYGSISAAWRHLMDPGHVGKLSFIDWSKALRQVGFQGNIKAAYQILDDDHSGIVTFSEFAPEVAEKIKDFRQKIFRTWGEDWNEVWKHVDEDGSNQVDKEEFSSLCFQIGYTGDHTELFKEIRQDQSRRFLNLDDFKAIPVIH